MGVLERDRAIIISEFSLIVPWMTHYSLTLKGHTNGSVLARCSAPERVRSIADSGAVGCTHSTGCRARFSMLCSRGRHPPCLLRLLRPLRHLCHGRGRPSSCDLSDDETHGEDHQISDN
jgi:hypothetical protein